MENGTGKKKGTELAVYVEAILFASAKPVAFPQLKKQLEVSDETLVAAVTDIRRRFNTERSGIHLLEQDEKIQLVTNPALGEVVGAFLKKEASGPLTRPALETLAVIAYRGPVTKPEIEQVRGVNCSLILRHLMVRGLVEEREDPARLQRVYTVSPDSLREFGVRRVDELPEFAAYHQDKAVTELMARTLSSEEAI
ncbi:SMC-Scp complex subunit ScpB [Candidatus Parcubacteria bacterium]|nr:SMC-Scp complex subunit ScpB [Candidatus Parcubacteria bacterium]